MVRKNVHAKREKKKEKREESEIGDLTTAIDIIRMVSNMKLSFKKRNQTITSTFCSFTLTYFLKSDTYLFLIY